MGLNKIAECVASWFVFLLKYYSDNEYQGFLLE